jgi:SAM-dependent methyltransferase
VLYERAHAMLFRTVSRAGVGPLALLLRAFFAIKYRAADPWRYATNDDEQWKYRETLAAIPRRRYDRVLEIGSGEGVFSAMLLADHDVVELIGVDVSVRAVERARARVASPRARFEVMDIFRESPAPPASFDLVLCAELLYYLGIRGRELADRIVWLLRPGGLVVLVDPASQAERLHAPFRGHASLELVSATVASHPVRPVEILLLRRA